MLNAYVKIWNCHTIFMVCWKLPDETILVVTFRKNNFKKRKALYYMKVTVHPIPQFIFIFIESIQHESCKKLLLEEP